MKKANRNTSNKIFCEHIPHLLHKTCNLEVLRCNIDCKTVRIFAYSNTREQSNKRSGTRLKTESERGRGETLKVRAYGRVRLESFARVRLLRHSLPISLLILRIKPTVFGLVATATAKCAARAKTVFLQFRPTDFCFFAVLIAVAV